ncbi:MAG: hypothetical protein HC810_04200 [Acaryochloridaceae cyanobacterium RL_2_7]|nr:hypothetical protein [Acaryochloridaceae cyanobacterium RL_2_7]
MGRKLGYYCAQVGFSEIQTQVEVIDSDRLGLDTILGLLSFGAPYRAYNEKLDAIADEVQNEVMQLIEQPYAWIGIGFFKVMAQKLG